jgi:hypothetical protein
MSGEVHLMPGGNYYEIENHPQKRFILGRLGKVGVDGVTFTSISARLTPPISPSTLSRYRREVMPDLISKSERARVVGIEAEIDRVEEADTLLAYAKEKIDAQRANGNDKVDVREMMSVIDTLQKGGRWRGTLGKWWTDSVEVSDATSQATIRAVVADTVAALAAYPKALEDFRQVLVAHKLAAGPDAVDDHHIIEHTTEPMGVPDW